MEPIVRPYDPHTDKEKIKELLLTVQLDTYKNINAGKIARCLNSLGHPLSPKLTVFKDVLCIENEPIGYCFYHTEQYTVCGKPIDYPRGIINMLVISHAYRGRRYGKFLLQETINKLEQKNTPEIQLFIPPENHEGALFFERHGFEDVTETAIKRDSLYKLLGYFITIDTKEMSLNLPLHKYVTKLKTA